MIPDSLIPSAAQISMSSDYDDDVFMDAKSQSASSSTSTISSASASDHEMGTDATSATGGFETNDGTSL